MTYRVRNIFVAVGLAVVAALLTTFYVANYKRHVRQAESTVTVYVAKKDIPAGTPGSELAGNGWLTTAEVSQRTVVPGAISNPEQVASLVTSQAVYSGEQITLRRFAYAGSARHPLAAARTAARDLAVGGSADQLLAGTLKDGDHVDVIANLKTASADGGDSGFAVRDVVQNLLVLHAPLSGNSGHGIVVEQRDVRDSGGQRPAPGSEGLLRGAERGRLDAPAAAGGERDPAADRCRRSRVDVQGRRHAREPQPLRRSREMTETNTNTNSPHASTSRATVTASRIFARPSPATPISRSSAGATMSLRRPASWPAGISTACFTARGPRSSRRPRSQRSANRRGRRSSSSRRPPPVRCSTRR